MAGSSLLTLLDDIATILDDVASMAKVAALKGSATSLDDVMMQTKIAATKTAGVLGDDIALNAQQVGEDHKDVLKSRSHAQTAARELPIVWAVAVGSIKNKLILIPCALLISVIAPWAITPLLMCGGAYLCYEGFEKVIEKWEEYVEHKNPQHVTHAEDHNPEENKTIPLNEDGSPNLVLYEKEKIKGAVRTDFILSAEIIAITLGIVTANKMPFMEQLTTLLLLGFAMTVGVYGLVGLIVKIDDIGLHLMQKKSELAQYIGIKMVASMPYIMKTLAFAGTVAMFTVGGSIITHGIHIISETLNSMTVGFGGFVKGFIGIVIDLIVGLIVGFLVVELHHYYVIIKNKLKNRGR